MEHGNDLAFGLVPGFDGIGRWDRLHLAAVILEKALGLIGQLQDTTLAGANDDPICAVVVAQPIMRCFDWEMVLNKRANGPGKPLSGITQKKVGEALRLVTNTLLLEVCTL